MKRILIAALLSLSMELTAFSQMSFLQDFSFENQSSGWTLEGGAGVVDWNNPPGGHALALENWGGNTSGSASQETYIWNGYAVNYFGYFYYQDADFSDNGAQAYIEISWANGDDNYYGQNRYYPDTTVKGAWNHQRLGISSYYYPDATQVKVVLGFDNASDANGSTAFFDYVELNSVPEPVSATLLFMGIGVVYLFRKKRIGA